MPIITEEEAAACREVDIAPFWHYTEPGAYRPPISLSYGGGVNSTALAVAIVERNLPLDIVAYASTGSDYPDTESYVKSFDDWLAGQGYPRINWLDYYDKNGEILTLEENCYKKSTLPSLAFGYKKCSLRFKVSNLDKYHNNNDLSKEAWERGYKVVKLLGYDADEGRRVNWASEEDEKYEYYWPLYDLEMTRKRCKEAIEQAGLCVPGKSSCFFCPAHSKDEIRALANDYPELAERAIQMEENAQENLEKVKGLGRSFSWKEFLEANREQQDAFPEPSRGITKGCMCWDG